MGPGPVSPLFAIVLVAVQTLWLAWLCWQESRIRDIEKENRALTNRVVELGDTGKALLEMLNLEDSNRSCILCFHSKAVHGTMCQARGCTCAASKTNASMFR